MYVCMCEGKDATEEMASNVFLKYIKISVPMEKN